MRVFIASLTHETSSFSPVPTNRASFDDFVAYRPASGRIDETGLALNGYGDFARAALADGHEVIASSFYWAQPSGPCVRGDYEALRDEILDDLRRAGPVDVVLLFLHGAQMAEDEPDCEGDLLVLIREIVGPKVFVGALLDLHANISDRMVAAASALVACREYPHSDFSERGIELYELGLRCAKGEVEPRSAYRRVPMIGMFYTTEPAMAAVVEAGKELERREGMLSVSLIHGFAWADTADTGAGVLAIYDGLTAGAEKTARAGVEELARRFFAVRNETRALRQPIGAIIDAIADEPPTGAPFVIADCCDNPGGGAGGDSTFILEEIVRRGIGGFAIGVFWDPVAARFAASAGVGARFPLRVGGKTGPLAGQPVDLDARVISITEGRSQHGIGFDAPLGLSVAIEAGGNVIVLNDVRGQVFNPSVFTDHGIDLSERRALVVKSTQHFREQFAPVARAIFYCETPGSLALDFDPELFRHVRRPIWPLDPVEHAGG